MKNKLKTWRVLCFCFMALCFFPFPHITIAQEIAVDNISIYKGNGRWDWTIFIKASTQVLDDIKCVKYTLHPTFSSPIRKKCIKGNTKYPFSLSTNGWGVFNIPTEITFKDGSHRRLNHMLKFSAPSVENPLDIKPDNKAAQNDDGWWNWTVYIEGSDKVLDQVQCVRYTLHHTFPDPQQEVCKRGTKTQPFRLEAGGWGTFQIAIKVFFKNGKTQNLKHDLVFPTDGEVDGY